MTDGHAAMFDGTSGNAIRSGGAAPLLAGGALGTPSSGTLTNATGLPLAAGVTGILAQANGGTGAALTTAGGLVLPQGRLTLTTAVPVLSGNVAAATTIYYSPYIGELVPIFNGTGFIPTPFAELSLALDSDSGHTGYHQSGKNFDLFVINDGGTIRLASGPAWTDDVTRAEPVSRLNGILVSDASIVLRFGISSGNTITYTAGPPMSAPSVPPPTGRRKCCSRVSIGRDRRRLQFVELL